MLVRAHLLADDDKLYTHRYFGAQDMPRSTEGP
jgi:hypothetical protein